MIKKDKGLVSKPVKLASIGVGMIGHVHAKFAAQIDECEYVAICDTDKSKEKMANKYGVRYYPDYLEMIEREKLDGVIISLPNEMHEKVGTECANRGLHIFLEKPITSTIDEAKKLIAIAHKNNVKLLIGHHRRFNPLVVATREMIKKNELGDLVGISCLWCMYKPPEYFVAGPWRKQSGSGGPILINMIHTVDDLRYMYGEIGRVYAEASNKTRKFEVEDTVSVSIRFNDGVLASVLMSDAAPSLWGYECTMGENPFFFPTKGDIYHFLGSKASLTFSGMRKVYYKDVSKAGWQHPINIEQLNIKKEDPYPTQLRHFCNVIRGEEKPRTSGEDALKTLEITLAILKSSQTGKPINIEIK